MEQISQIVAMIGGIVATILLPLIGAFQFYDSKKRKEAAAAKKAEAENITQYAAEWKELYEKKEAKVHELDTKIASIKLAAMGYQIDTLTEAQKKYLGLD